jgi:hypothetical protein
VHNVYFSIETCPPELAALQIFM